MHCPCGISSDVLSVSIDHIFDQPIYAIMRVALIHTDSDPWALGMRSVSAVLKEAGHPTRIILMGSSERFYSQQVLEEAKEIAKDSDIIGISCVSRGSEKARQVIEHLRPLGKLIVWGGIHATLNPKECAESADLVCRGEGEGMMLELMERLAAGKDWKDIANAAYKTNGRMTLNALRPLVNNLDELPLVDFTYDEEFHLTNRGFVRATGITDMTEPIIFNGSRGCAHECNYCSNAVMKRLYSGNGVYVRKMTISRYIEQARELKKYFPRAKYFFLADEDFFTRSIDELREFAKEWPRQVKLPFECCASPWRINQNKMDFLVKAGLWRIRMGIESGSECTKRDVYNRHVSNEKVMHAAQIISRYPQVVPYYFMIIANPYEKPKDLIETARLMATLPSPYYLQAFNLVFFPGTVLYHRAVRDGLIDGKQDSGFELDFRGGLKYKGHAWKRKNLYLNGLLFIMEGKSTRRRQGLLPRFLLPYLLHPKMVDFSEKHPAPTKLLIAMNLVRLSLRARGAKLFKRIIGDPTSVYNLKGFLKRTLQSNTVPVKQVNRK